MLRLTGLARRSVLLRLPANHAPRSVFIARTVLPTSTLLRRPYSSEPHPNYVRWTPAQKTFVLGLLTKINTAPVMEALMNLGPEKAAHFMELLQEISEDGARDSLSIGRVLAFLNTNDIDLNSVQEQDYASNEELREDEVLPSQKIPRLSREEVIALAKEQGSPPEELEALSKLTDEELDALHEEALQSMAGEVPEEEPTHEIPGGPAGNHRWPNLMERDPLMDSRDVLDMPATPDMPYHNRVVIRNHESMFHEAMRLEAEMEEQADEMELQEEDSEFDDGEARQVEGPVERLSEDEVEDLMEKKGDNAFVYKYASLPEPTAREGSQEEEADPEEEEGEHDREDAQTFTETDITSPTPDIYNRTGISKSFNLRDPDIHVYEYSRMTKQQTGKGKITRVQIFVIVGNGDGLIGFGKGTHAAYMHAKEKAYAQAIRNIDYVDRFEDRTVWTTLEDKFGSSKIVIRPRPLGFGLRCGPTLHKVFRAAGISDISAKIWKSRNRLVVTQGALRMLQAGHNPLGKGNGAGGPARRLEKGKPLQNAESMSRSRGRFIVPLRK